jgi:dihydroorotase
MTEALLDGTIDAIASDHAPHADEEKERGLVDAPFGFVGLETTLPLVLTHLVRPGLMTLEEAIARMTLVPAEILGLPVGRILDGAPGDLAIIDPDICWEIDRDKLHSKSRNTPYHGWTVYGRAVTTIVGGQVHEVV